MRSRSAALLVFGYLDGMAPGSLRMWLPLVLLSAAAARAGLPRALPDAPQLPKETHAALEAALAERDPETPARTQHHDDDGQPLYTNRLLLEASPYLQQHAHNPVDWHPWGDEAFEKARALGRPVLLSIGYSTCHWCHVMEEESFDDLATARVLNAHFIAIKVDREARPDVDSVYMAALHAMGQRGGWPLNVFLTPEREPFFGGTYFPPTGSPNRPSFKRVLAAVSEQWEAEPERLREAAGALTGRVQQSLGSSAGLESREVAADAIDRVVAESLAGADPEWGGLGEGMKFPSSLNLRLLMRWERDEARRAEGTPEAATNRLALRELVVRTLDQMARGGIRDHLAGGFHRYSTDRRWLVPHFEKMLYDNAQLARLYVEAWQWSGEARYRDVATDTLEYLDREMSAPGGGFYSATDADSRGPSGEVEEGLYFSWTPDELQSALGEEDARLAAAWYGVTDRGHLDGRSVLHTGRSEEAVAAELGVDLPALRAGVERARPRLLQARSARPAPLRDDKVVTSWNALAISAFAQAGFAFDEERWRERARCAARFMLEHLRVEGRLHRLWLDGTPSVDAFLGDHLLLADALLDLYEADGDPRWLREAASLQAQVEAHFADPTAGGYFQTRADGEALLAREKPRYDAVVPAGNAVAARVLARLAELTGEASYRASSALLWSGASADIDRRPAAFSEWLLALELLSGAQEIVIVAPAGALHAVFEPMLAPLRRQLVTARVLALVVEGEHQARTAEVVTLAGNKPAAAGEVTAYVCEDRVCRLPTTDPIAFAAQLSIARAASR